MSVTVRATAAKSGGWERRKCGHLFEILACTIKETVLGTIRMEVSTWLGMPVSNPVFIISTCLFIALAVLIYLRSDNWVDPAVFTVAMLVGVSNVKGFDYLDSFQITPLLQYATSEDRARTEPQSNEVSSAWLAGVTVSCAVGFIIYEAAVLG